MTKFMTALKRLPDDLATPYDKKEPLVTHW